MTSIHKEGGDDWTHEGGAENETQVKHWGKTRHVEEQDFQNKTGSNRNQIAGKNTWNLRRNQTGTIKASLTNVSRTHFKMGIGRKCKDDAGGRKSKA